VIHFDVAIVGGGPGGYVTAIRLQQYGIKAVVFEKDRLGGVCLNYGCIPTKTLVKRADFFADCKHSIDYGFTIDNLQIDYKKIKEQKEQVVEKLVSGIEFIFKKKKIDNIKESVYKINKVGNKFNIFSKSNTDELSQYSANYVIIATGSLNKELPFMKFDAEKILSSKEILNLSELPKELLVVGGGVIGCEFASIFNQFGVKVQIVEFLPSLLPNEDKDLSKRLAMSLKKSGIKLHLKTSVQSYRKENDKLFVSLSNGKELSADKVLVSVGRRPISEIDFGDLSLNHNEFGFVEINDLMETNIENIFAIGDVTGKLMLAHTASKMGLVVADIIFNKLNPTKTLKEIQSIDYKNIPACTFTNPEIGSVGLTEIQAKAQYEEILVGKFPYSANGKALGSGHTFGFAKVIADKKSERIIGMHIIGYQATELIAEGAILIGMKANINDIKKIVFAHPTLSEIIAESIEDLENFALHKI